ncbi:MAG: hypothetical protein U9Q92_00115 [archaeon]|nr:hypothetical protein [archaeon]
MVLGHDVKNPGWEIFLDEGLTEIFGPEDFPEDCRDGAVGGVMAVYRTESGVARLRINMYSTPECALGAYESIKQEVRRTAKVGYRNDLPVWIVTDERDTLVYSHGPVYFVIIQRENLLFRLRILGMSENERDFLLGAFS